WQIQQLTGGIENVPLVGQVEQIELLTLHERAKTVLPGPGPVWVEHQSLLVRGQDGAQSRVQFDNGPISFQVDVPPGNVIGGLIGVVRTAWMTGLAGPGDR